MTKISEHFRSRCDYRTEKHLASADLLHRVSDLAEESPKETTTGYRNRDGGTCVNTFRSDHVINTVVLDLSSVLAHDPESIGFYI